FIRTSLKNVLIRPHIFEIRSRAFSVWAFMASLIPLKSPLRSDLIKSRTLENVFLMKLQTSLITPHIKSMYPLIKSKYIENFPFVFWSIQSSAFPTVSFMASQTIENMPDIEFQIVSAAVFIFSQICDRL